MKRCVPLAPAPAGISSPRATSVRIPEADPNRRYAAASAVVNSGGGGASMSRTGAIDEVQRRRFGSFPGVPSSSSGGDPTGTPLSFLTQPQTRAPPGAVSTHPCRRAGGSLEGAPVGPGADAAPEAASACGRSVGTGLLMTVVVVVVMEGEGAGDAGASWLLSWDMPEKVVLLGTLR